jgi:hypothetical protein
MQPWSSSTDREGGERRGIAILQRHCGWVRPEHSTCGRAPLCLTSHSLSAKVLAPRSFKSPIRAKCDQSASDLVTTRSGRAFSKLASCWGAPAPHHPEQPFHDPSTKHPTERHKESPHKPDQYRVCSDNCEHNSLLRYILAELPPTRKWPNRAG